MLSYLFYKKTSGLTKINEYDIIFFLFEREYDIIYKPIHQF